MDFQSLKFFSFIVYGMLVFGTASGQSRIDDWSVEGNGQTAEGGGRIAFTLARPDPASAVTPRLIIRQLKPDSPVELLVIATHDPEKDECDYKEWKMKVDSTEVPVLGYTFEPAQTELKANWGTPDKELWEMFRQGLNLTLEAEKKCASQPGAPQPLTLVFSLRGSYAAYKFVTAGKESTE